MYRILRADGEMATLTPEEIEALPPPYMPSIDDYRRAIQAHIDKAANQRGYDSGVTCSSYTVSTNAIWAAEALAFVAWRDLVWAHTYGELASVQAGESDQQSISDFLAGLPLMVWPE